MTRPRRSYLTFTETAILRVLQRQNGEPMSGTDLDRAVWGKHEGQRTRLYAHLNNMRHLAGIPVQRTRDGFYLGTLRERIEPSDIEHRLLFPDTFALHQRAQAAVQAQRPSHQSWERRHDLQQATERIVAIALGTSTGGDDE